MKQPIPIFAPQAQKYHAFDRYEYDFEGHTAIVCLPQQDTDETKPFIWRTEFFGAFDQADEEMLRRGYVLVHYRIPDLLGCDEAVRKMGRFFAHLVQSWGFCAKTVLFGFSRGGLYAVNFAAAFPDHVAALYLDAPVLDLKSWPAGLGMGLGSAKDTELAYRLYELNARTIRSFQRNPIDRVDILTEHHIPVVLVAGEKDRDVPYAENGARLARKYRAAGVTCTRFLKPNCAHHPHSLEDPTPICDALEQMIGQKTT